MIDQKAFAAAWEAMGWDNQNPQATEAQERFVAAYETARLAGVASTEELQQPEAWPANIVAERHEASGKWVVWYLTDEQAAICQRVLPRKEEQCGVCGDHHEVDEVPYTCQTGDGV